MANISLQDPNFVYVDNYFYTINDSLQLLVKKTFDLLTEVTNHALWINKHPS